MMIIFLNPACSAVSVDKKGMLKAIPSETFAVLSLQVEFHLVAL